VSMGGLLALLQLARWIEHLWPLCVRRCGGCEESGGSRRSCALCVQLVWRTGWRTREWCHGDRFDAGDAGASARSDCPVRHTLCTYMVPCVSYREGCVCIASAVPTYLPTYSCTYLQLYLPTAVPTYLPTYLPTAVPIHTQPSLYDTQCVSHTVQIYRGYSTV
jgi:hypothetical protein